MPTKLIQYWSPASEAREQAIHALAEIEPGLAQYDSEPSPFRRRSIAEEVLLPIARRWEPLSHAFCEQELEALDTEAERALADLAPILRSKVKKDALAASDAAIWLLGTMALRAGPHGAEGPLRRAQTIFREVAAMPATPA